MEISLTVPLVLSVPIIAIAGLVTATGARNRVRPLEQRFADFQGARRPVLSLPRRRGSRIPQADCVAPRRRRDQGALAIGPGVGIVIFYQRLLFPRRRPAAPLPTLIN